MNPKMNIRARFTKMFKFMIPKGDERDMFENYRDSHVILWIVIIQVTIGSVVLNHVEQDIPDRDVLQYIFTLIIFMKLVMASPSKKRQDLMEKRLRTLGSIKAMRRSNRNPTTFIMLSLGILVVILRSVYVCDTVMFVFIFAGFMRFHYIIKRFEKGMIDMIEEEQEKERQTNIAGGHRVDV